MKNPTDIATTVLVDLDPHKQNQPAIDRAHLLGRECHAAVHLFVCEYLQWLSGGVVVDAEVVDNSRRQYLSDLEDWARSLAEPLLSDDIDVSVHAAWQTPRFEAVIQRAEEIDADLIVRVAREHGTLQRMFLSATDWELIRHSPQTLWLVKSADVEQGALNFLAAVDPAHPKDEKMALDRHLMTTASALSDALGGSLHVYHAYSPPAAVAPMPMGAAAGAAAAPLPRIDEDVVDRVRKMHWSRLEELVGQFDVEKERIHLLEGNPAARITDVVEEHDIDVVVAGAVSRSWLQRLLIGSTAEALFDAVDCDVVVVKMPDTD